MKFLVLLLTTLVAFVSAEVGARPFGETYYPDEIIPLSGVRMEIGALHAMDSATNLITIRNSTGKDIEVSDPDNIRLVLKPRSTHVLTCTPPQLISVSVEKVEREFVGNQFELSCNSQLEFK